MNGNEPRRPNKKTVEIAALNTEGLQTRLVALQKAVVEDYAERMRDGAKFPPVTVIREGKVYYLADGFHRVAASKEIGKRSITADVRTGTFTDALRIALGANATHGLRRTVEDKQNALEMAWANRDELFGGEPSHAALAEICGVSVSTARRFRQGCSKNIPDEETEEIWNGVEEDLGTDSGEASGSAPAIPSRPSAPIPVPRRIGRDGKAYPVPSPVRQTSGGVPVPKHAPGVILDRFGVEVPTAIRGAFTDKALEEVARWISSARTVLRRMADEKDPAAAQISQSALLELDNAAREVRFGRPYCVCRMCQGDGCKACRESGFQTEAQYNKNPPERKVDTNGGAK